MDFPGEIAGFMHQTFRSDMIRPMADLGDLREKIAHVDRALLELIRERMDLAASVGRIKAEQGHPVVVRDVEDRVLGRARLHAEECGISEEVMSSIFRSIIEGSVERQHRVGVHQRTERGERVLVVGGAGNMGGWFRFFLGLVGHQVDILDPAVGRLPQSSRRFSTFEEVPDLDVYDAIIVAVPLHLTPETLEKLGRFNPRGLIVEISSIKNPLKSSLLSLKGPVSCLHPMFGPEKSPYQQLTFVVACREVPEEERGRLERLLRHPYTDLITVPFDHHDRLMGWLLGLAHLTGILFGTALTQSGLEPSELQRCASTTFARQAETARSVLSNDPDLYMDIQRLNPFRDNVYEATRGALDDLVGLIRSGDREGFRDSLSAARRALGETP